MLAARTDARRPEADPGLRAAPVALSEIHPVYPLGARRRGEEGVVALTAWVDEHGTTVKTEVSASSGFATLDEAAVRAVSRARFQPAGSDVRPLAGRTDLRIRFRLDDPK